MRPIIPVLVGLTLLPFAPPVAAFQTPARPTVHVGPNLRVSANVREGERNEGWLVASATDPRVLVGTSHGQRGCVVYVSTDGGYAWREMQVDTASTCFDPMTAAGPNGRLYALGTAVSGRAPTSGQRSERPIGVWWSADSAKSWKGPGLMRTPLTADHPRLAVDMTGGRHHGNVYVAWNEVSDTFFPTKYHIFLNRSTDGGVTFSEPVIAEVDSGGKLVTTEPIVLSDGTLLVTYYQYFQPLNRRKNWPVYLIRSTDGGVTLGRPEKIGEVGLSAWPEKMDNADRTFTSAFTLPIFAADQSTTSRFRDRVYIVWDDINTGTSNIWISWSADKGRTWSPQKRINDNPPMAAGGPPDHRMTPTVAVNKDGVVGVAWYDRRDDPARQCWKYFFSASFDGGETFLPNTAVSSAPSCPPKAIAPTVGVLNAKRDTAPISPDSIDALVRKGQFGQAYDLERRRLLQAANAKLPAGRLKLSFDPGRSQWPGHYTGLAARADGSFQGMWADRRNVLQQMYSARIDIVTEPTATAASLREAVVTELVEIVAGPVKYDSLQGTSTFDIQLRNVSQQTIHGPLRLRVKDVTRVGNTPSLSVISSDAGKGESAFWDFSKGIGSRQQFTPGMLTEPRTITIRTQRETGLDGELVFEVVGRTGS